MQTQTYIPCDLPLYRSKTKIGKQQMFFFFKSHLYAAFCSFFGKFHFHVRSHYGVVVYLPRGIFKAIKFPNVNQFRSIFTVFFVLQARFIIYISNSRSLAPAAAVTQKKLQQAFLLPILAGYCGVGEP